MSLVNYEFDGKVATITLDDGKVNVLGLAMQAEINAALDRAEADRAVVILTSGTATFSGGFDLKLMMAGGDERQTMIHGGFELSHRLLSFPAPVVIACPGHAIAMGAFLLLSGDYLVGANGTYRLTANEVAIGLSLPEIAIAILRNRLTPAHLLRVAALAEPCTPANAVEAGFLDRVVEPAELMPAARTVAEAAAGLDRAAHTLTKLRVRRSTLDVMRAMLAQADLGISTADS